MICDCGKEAIISLPIYRKKLCKDCFTEFYEKKVSEFIKKWKLINDGEKIIVAISGGKDSVACLTVLKKLSNQLNFKVKALHINLGFSHSVATEKVVRKVCKQQKVELRVFNFKKSYGNLEDLIKRSCRPACSLCGVVKRYIFNKISREENADKLATGHHMDDMIELAIKNFLSGNFSWITKQKPFLKGSGKMVARIKPLFEREAIENETYLKCLGVEWDKSVCPYKPKRKKLKEGIDCFFKLNPRLKLQFIKSLERFEYPEEKIELKNCSICGEPTEKEICSFCHIIGKTR
jgi:tRNA(Ile)-lysidine synthase TilS/MesJ